MHPIVNDKFNTLSLVLQVHRGIKGVVRDKDTDDGIAGAVIKVEDIDHHIRSGTVNILPVIEEKEKLTDVLALCSQLLVVTTGGC